ncbi:MAG TPA: RNA polymerase sigma factor [Pyrinomonadaceae bacterium]|nr:RNA polymerase sigma factor [Pyrinomonadaceae bacterium]
MTLPDTKTDNDLLRSLLDGDEQALATLYRRRQGSVYRFALQMSGSHALAEDVTQEVFLVLIRGEAKYDPERGSVNAFMLGIARNHVLRRLRYQQALVSFADDSEAGGGVELVANDGPLDELSRGETINAVRRAVLSLPPHYREVVVFCELQEMSYAEAAEILGCAVGTVRSRLHRARALLIEKLRPAAPEEAAEEAAGSTRCFA